MAIVPIVEGPGDVSAVPVLLRRLLERLARWDVQILRPKNANGKSKLLRKFENFLQYAKLEPDCKAILVMLDADEDCPVKLAIGLADRAMALGLQVPVAIVVSNHEYETWFIAALDASPVNPVRIRLSLNAQAVAPPDPDNSVPNPKAWLQQFMPRDLAYKETEDQVALSQQIDLDMVFARSRSFQRLQSAVNELLQAIDSGEIVVSPYA